MMPLDSITVHAIAFQPNQIKQTDPVTRDDQGNVIPLSERFNPGNNDIRFSRREGAEKEASVVDIDSTKTPSRKDDVIKMIPEGGVSYPNDDQNRDIRVSRKSIRHSLDHADLYKIQAAANAEGIVKNAVKLGEIPVATDEIGKTNSVSVFYCPVRIDRKLYSARLVVKQYINQKGDVLDDLALYDMNVHNKKTVPSVSNVAGSPGRLY